MRKPLADHVAAEVRAELARRSMTWAQLAAALQKSEMWVSRRLREGAPQEISLTELEGIAGVLDLPATEFLPEQPQAAAS